MVGGEGGLLCHTPFLPVKLVPLFRGNKLKWILLCVFSLFKRKWCRQAYVYLLLCSLTLGPGGSLVLIAQPLRFRVVGQDCLVMFFGGKISIVFPLLMKLAERNKRIVNSPTLFSSPYGRLLNMKTNGDAS